MVARVFWVVAMQLLGCCDGCYAFAWVFQEPLRE